MSDKLELKSRRIGSYDSMLWFHRQTPTERLRKLKETTDAGLRRDLVYIHSKPLYFKSYKLGYWQKELAKKNRKAAKLYLWLVQKRMKTCPMKTHRRDEMFLYEALGYTYEREGI